MKDSHKALNDLISVAEILTELIVELNPGATNEIARIRFLLERAEQCVARAALESDSGDGDRNREQGKF
jgi:hypothetical protein